MTDRARDDRDVEAQRARLEALHARRTTGRVPHARHRHAARRTRIGVATSSVAAMFSLIGVMALVRPPSTPPPPPLPDGNSATPLPAAAAIATTTAAPQASPSSPEATSTPAPVPLTAPPRVRVTTTTQPAPTARTHGSH